MKTLKSITAKTKTQEKPIKVFKPLYKKQLEVVVGGPVTSRGTVTTVQPG